MNTAWALDVSQKSNAIAPYYQPQQIQAHADTWRDKVMEFLRLLNDMNPFVAVAVLVFVYCLAKMAIGYWKSEDSNWITDKVDRFFKRKKDGKTD